MTTADPSSPRVAVTLTHVALGPWGNGDAVGRIEATGRPVFVPGRIPCGDCGVCRRGWPACCPRADALLDDAERPRARMDAPERHLTPLDEPLDVAPLPSSTVALAGLVARVIDATARAGLGPGDTAVWLGDGAVARLGALATARRGCRVFTLGFTCDAEGAAVLPVSGDPRTWETLVSAAEAAAGAGPERRLFVCGGAPGLLDAALALAPNGATVTLLAGAPALIHGLDRHHALRILVHAGYHPDLVPEALAGLRRGDASVASLVREVDAATLGAALGGLRAGDPRVPVLAL